jgi:hypothetical protein
VTIQQTSTWCLLFLTSWIFHGELKDKGIDCHVVMSGSSDVPFSAVSRMYLSVWSVFDSPFKPRYAPLCRSLAACRPTDRITLCCPTLYRQPLHRYTV